VRIAQIGVVVQAVLYIGAGINHFWHERFYLHIMPDHYGQPGLLVQLTGIAEIAGGLGLLLPATRGYAGVGLALMLVGYFDVHIFMVRHAERFPEVPGWFLWGRIALQFVLIAWALQAARVKGGLL
jgi:uncharacterized membrane protein